MNLAPCMAYADIIEGTTSGQRRRPRTPWIDNIRLMIGMDFLWSPLLCEAANCIGVNFCKAPRLDPPPHTQQGFPAYEHPTFCQMQFFRYSEAVFAQCTSNKMILNDIDASFI